MNHQQESGDESFDSSFERSVIRILGSMPHGEAFLASTGLDSLGLLNLLMGLEDDFDALWPLEYLTASPAELTIDGLRKLTKDVLCRGDGA
jgi:hypothetical protein